ncbi:MAG: XRE family transcriptional regulator [Clostridia bacterium]|nr:XRE family transcriptional regulator [Clostridia bacterium]
MGMKKTTAQLLKDLKLNPDFKTFYRKNQDSFITESLADLLNDLLQQSGKSKAAVIRDSQISEIYGYKIFDGEKIPKRNKLLALAFGMGLNLSQTQKLLRCAGYAQLYAKIPFDSVVIYALCKKLTVQQLNDLLYAQGFGILE